MSGEGGSPVEGPRVDPMAYAFLGMMVLLGSTTAPAAKLVVKELPTGLIPLIRFGVSGLVLLPLVWRSPAFRRLLRDDAPRLLLTAACCVPINQSFFLNGARLTSATHIALIYAACPLIVLGLATLLGQERFGLGRLTGVLASVAGLVLIAVGNLRDGSASGRDVLRGDLLEIGAVLAWGAYLTVGKPLVARHGSLPTLAGTFLVGALLDLPLAAWSSQSWPSLAGVSTTAWLALAYLTLVVTTLGLLFQNLSLRRLDASQVATFGNASPLLTMVWGNLLFGDRLTPALAFGGSLILLGLLVTNRPPRRAGSGRRTLTEVPPVPLVPSVVGAASR